MFMPDDLWIEEHSKMVREDALCKKWRKEIEVRTPAFLRIYEKLSEAEQEELDLYIAVCEAAERSEIFPAYTLGFIHGKQSRGK